MERVTKKLTPPIRVRKMKSEGNDFCYCALYLAPEEDTEEGVDFREL